MSPLAALALAAPLRARDTREASGSAASSLVDGAPRVVAALVVLGLVVYLGSKVPR